MRLRYVVVLIAALAIVAVVARGERPRASVNAPVPAVLDGWLVRLDPRSLTPLRGGRVRMPERIDRWAQAPDGSRLAVVSGSRVRFIDLKRMRPAGALRCGAAGDASCPGVRGRVVAVVWARHDRVFVVVGAPGATEVVAIDPLQPRVIARRRVGAALMRVAATPGELVLLLAPGSTIGPATLATVDGNGDVETVRLRIAAGLLPTEGVPFILRTRRPGLAVDARGRRAYVLTARPDVVEVDLAERRVQHHRITPARSLLDRLHDLVEPRAEAQQAVGPVRVADWIAPGTIAVAGQDAHVSWQPGGAIRRVTRPAGLQVIDTERWQTHTLDEGASGFRTARGLLLTDGDGLTAYQPDGGRAFHVLDDRRVELVATSGTLAYVREAARLHVVDLELGRVIGAGRPPDLLLDQTPAHGAG